MSTSAGPLSYSISQAVISLHATDSGRILRVPLFLSLFLRYLVLGMLLPNLDGLHVFPIGHGNPHDAISITDRLVTQISVRLSSERHHALGDMAIVVIGSLTVVQCIASR